MATIYLTGSFNNQRLQAQVERARRWPSRESQWWLDLPGILSCEELTPKRCRLNIMHVKLLYVQQSFHIFTCSVDSKGVAEVECLFKEVEHGATLKRRKWGELWLIARDENHLFIVWQESSFRESNGVIGFPRCRVVRTLGSILKYFSQKVHSLIIVQRLPGSCMWSECCGRTHNLASPLAPPANLNDSELWICVKRALSGTP